MFEIDGRWIEQKVVQMWHLVPPAYLATKESMAPEVVYKLEPKAQVRFLFKHFNIFDGKVEVHMHTGLSGGSLGPLHGVAEFPDFYDFPEPLPENCELLKIHSDLSYTIVDSARSDAPLVVKMDKKMIAKKFVARVGLEQALLSDPKRMSMIIAHEVAHHYLSHRQFHLPHFDGGINYEKEYETDLAMFLMGLGKIAMGPIDASSYRVQKISYMTVEQMKHSQEVIEKNLG